MSARQEREFDGFRVLVVEDEYYVAKGLGLSLDAMGCKVIGPASTAKEASRLIKEEDVQGALLDIRLSPGTSAPVARDLIHRSCPFVFVTGYANLEMLPDDLRGYRVLHKPIDHDSLRLAIRELAGSRAGSIEK